MIQQCNATTCYNFRILHEYPYDFALEVTSSYLHLLKIKETNYWFGPHIIWLASERTDDNQVTPLLLGLITERLDPEFGDDINEAVTRFKHDFSDVKDIELGWITWEKDSIPAIVLTFVLSRDIMITIRNVTVTKGPT